MPKKILIQRVLFPHIFVAAFTIGEMSSGHEADIEEGGDKKRLLRKRTTTSVEPTPWDMKTRSIEVQDKKRGEMLRELATHGNDEVGHIISKITQVSAEGKLSYNYISTEWSHWFKKITEDDDIQERAMLEGLASRLKGRGYDAVVPYRNGPDAKMFLHVSWKSAESTLLLGGCIEKSQLAELGKIFGAIFLSVFLCVCTFSLVFAFYHLSLIWSS